MAISSGLKSVRHLGGTIVAAGIVIVPWVGASPALALAERFSDPDDVTTPLDVKTVSHTNDDRLVTYTLETYTSFPDERTAFEWAVDKNSDGTSDVMVAVQWDGVALVGRVKDAGGNPIAGAVASRPAPNAVRVSFSASVLRGATAYVYGVTALSGVDDGNSAASDRAPDTGSYHHTLARGTTQAAVGPPPQPAPEPAAVGEAPAPAALTEASGDALGEEPALPRTGSGTTRLLMAGAGLLAVGAWSRRVGERRPRTRAENRRRIAARNARRERRRPAVGSG